jgi:Uma2 family endonuclease
MMRHELEHPPRTIMEVFKMLPEGTLAELIEGTLFMSPSPNRSHQKILGKLFIQLSTLATTKGEVYIAPFDVYLDEVSNAVQPDLIFVASSRSSIVREDAIHGVPDLLIEVLSPGNQKHDLVKKKELYEKFGVKEYWIIDPETRESIGYTFNDDVFVECGRHLGKVASVLLNHDFIY